LSTEKFDLDAALADEATPAGLRDWAKKQADQNRKLADELAEFRATQRSSTLAAALKDAGVSEKLARFYPNDAGTDGESIGKWLKENADVFGGTKPADDAAPAPTVDHNALPTDMLAAMRQIQAATPTTGSTEGLADRAARVDGLKMNTAEDRAVLDEFIGEISKLAAQDQTSHYAQMMNR
jgi:hypothetical protein